MQILLVDDSPVVLMATSIIINNLVANEPNIMTANDAEEALDIIKNNSFDIIISDLCMPGKNGDQLAKEIKENNFSKAAKIFISSAKDPEAEEQELINKYCDGFLYKPLTNVNLKDIFKDFI